MAKKMGDKSTAKRQTANSAEKKSRRIQPPKYKSFGLQKKIKRSDVQPVPNVIRLTKQSLQLTKRSWKQFAVIMLIYGALNILLVQGLGSLGSDTRSDAADLSTVTSAVQVGNGAMSQTGSLYQSILLVILSLTFIWSLRQVYVNEKFSVRDAFYKSMYPLIPFLLVVAVVMLELIPMALGGTALSIALASGIAASTTEILIWAFIVSLLAILSIFLVSSSLFALIVVTLPVMTPIKALRSAKQLVINRRLLVMRKLLFLPFLLFVVVSLVITPFVIWLPQTVLWLFLPLMLVITPFVYAYIYNLYRELM